MHAKISESTVRRLSHYYRVLEEVAAEGQRMISSHLLAERRALRDMKLCIEHAAAAMQRQPTLKVASIAA